MPEMFNSNGLQPSVNIINTLIVVQAEEMDASQIFTSNIIVAPAARRVKNAGKKLEPCFEFIPLAPSEAHVTEK